MFLNVLFSVYFIFCTFRILPVFGRSIDIAYDDYYNSPFQPLNEDYVDESNSLYIRNIKGGSCILDVNKDLPKKNEPLILSPNQSKGVSLVLPEAEGKNGVIALREGEEILITCPGNKNFLESTKEGLNRAVCRSGTTLTINGQQLKSDALDCSSRAAATTKITQKPCAGGKGVIIELGFEAAGWTKLVEVCHNIAQSNTYYAVHNINGANLAGKVYRKTGRPNFARGDRQLFKGFNPETAYSQKNQHAVFGQLLGKEQAEELFGQKSTFLARGHLAPDADFLLSPHQLLTYFYVNVGPQWQSINAGNWLRVEENTRRVASNHGADVEVVTGTFGVLRLPGQKGEKEITLHQSSIPVPELFWKVLRNTQDDSCIAFVASNNPFLTEKPRQICKDVCAQNNWPLYQEDFSKGYIYCCEYNQIKKAIPDMPNLQCTSTLKG